MLKGLTNLCQCIGDLANVFAVCRDLANIHLMSRDNDYREGKITLSICSSISNHAAVPIVAMLINYNLRQCT